MRVRTFAIIVLCGLFTLAPVAAAAASPSFWEVHRLFAPVIAAAVVCSYVTLVVGRYRWAWGVLLLFGLASLVAGLVDPEPVGGMGGTWLPVTLVELALLLSTPMRSYLRTQVTLPRSFARSTPAP